MLSLFLGLGEGLGLVSAFVLVALVMSFGLWADKGRWRRGWAIMVMLIARWCCWWKGRRVGRLGGVWLVSGIGMPRIVLVFGLALSLAFLVLAFSALGLLARRLGKDVGDGDWVLEDLLGGLFEGHVVAHLHGDCPRERVPGFFDIGKALRVLAGKLDESFDICVNGLLVGDLDEDPGPSNCI